jgi:hypothetical protein
MAQQINLYQAQFRVAKRRYSAKNILHAATVIFCLMMIIAAYNGWKIFELRNQAAAIEQQTLSITQQKVELERKVILAHADPALVDKVERSEDLLKNQRQLRALLDEDLFSRDQGYSHYLVALARQHIPGLWLTDIRLSGAGQNLVLRGQTIAPELLPLYLQNLSKEAVLHGMRFQVFQLNRMVNKKKSETAGNLEFLLATSKVSEAKP